MITFAEADGMLGIGRESVTLGDGVTVRYHTSDWRELSYQGRAFLYTHRDGRYCLAMTVESHDRAAVIRLLNQYGPAKITAGLGALYVGRLDGQDPRTAPRIRRCRTCDGRCARTGTDGRMARTEDGRIDWCARCNGSGSADYGSKPNLWRWTGPSIITDADGKPQEGSRHRRYGEDHHRAGVRSNARASEATARAGNDGWTVDLARTSEHGPQF